MGLFDEVTNAVSTPIVPQDRFIFECLSIDEAPPYAAPGAAPDPNARPGIKWVFGLYYPENGSRFQFMDEPYEFFQTTTANMQRGARAREYAEALLGRELGEGERVNPNDLIGKRGIGLVSHEWNKAKTKKSAKLIPSGPYKEAVAARPTARTATATAVMDRPSASSVSADATDAELDRAFLVASVEKKVKQAEKLQTRKHLDWIAMDLSVMDTDELDAIKASIQADIDAD